MREDRTASIISVEEIHFQRQGNNLLCGLHAVNHLLGTSRYSESDFDHLEKVLEHVSGQSHKHCCGGDYDVNILIQALQNEQHSTKWLDSRKPISLSIGDNLVQTETEVNQLVGFLINVPNSHSRFIQCIAKVFCMSTRHWLCMKKINATYFLLDSSLNGPLELTNKKANKMLELYRENDAEIIAVMKKSA